MVHDTLLPHDASRHQIFVGGGGGGGGSGPFDIKKNKNSSDNVVFSLVFKLLNRSQMVTFKVNFHFPRFQRGPTFTRRGSNFFQGGRGVSNC